ncbi:hypothetical protein EB008_05920, partial [bacterium]|nr:hypothetical protein [bacterium]
ILNRQEKQQLTSLRCEKGLDDLLNFYLSRIETLQQQTENAQIENYRLASMVRLIKSLGGGFMTPELPDSAP